MHPKGHLAYDQWKERAPQPRYRNGSEPTFLASGNPIFEPIPIYCIN